MYCSQNNQIREFLFFKRWSLWIILALIFYILIENSFMIYLLYSYFFNKFNIMNIQFSDLSKTIENIFF